MSGATLIASDTVDWQGVSVNLLNLGDTTTDSHLDRYKSVGCRVMSCKTKILSGINMHLTNLKCHVKIKDIERIRLALEILREAGIDLAEFQDISATLVNYCELEQCGDFVSYNGKNFHVAILTGNKYMHYVISDLGTSASLLGCLAPAIHIRSMRHKW